MVTAITPQEALQKAIAICGSKSELARRLGIKQPSIDDWRQVPAARAIAVEKACNGEVKRHELRPDIYPPEDAAA